MTADGGREGEACLPAWTGEAASAVGDAQEWLEGTWPGIWVGWRVWAADDAAPTARRGEVELPASHVRQGSRCL